MVLSIFTGWSEAKLCVVAPVQVIALVCHWDPALPCCGMSRRAGRRSLAILVVIIPRWPETRVCVIRARGGDSSGVSLASRFTLLWNFEASRKKFLRDVGGDLY